MTLDMPEAVAPGGPAAQPRTCPRCETPLGDTQEWCLHCGAAARTVIATTPPWRMPVALVALVVTLVLIAVAIAIVAVANTDGDVAPISGPAATSTAPAAAPPPLEGTAPLPGG